VLPDIALAIVDRHPGLFSKGGFRRQFLTPYFVVGAHFHVVKGNRAKGLKYVLKGFRHTGVWNLGLWGCLAGVILGKTVFTKLTPFLEWLWFARKRLLNRRHGHTILKPVRNEMSEPNGIVRKHVSGAEQENA